jgi:hypothetical protein
VSRPSCPLAPGKGPPGTHCTGGWVGSRACLDTEARGKVFFCLCWESNPVHPVCCQTLYWLSYPDSTAPPVVMTFFLSYFSWYNMLKIWQIFWYRQISLMSSLLSYCNKRAQPLSPVLHCPRSTTMHTIHCISSDSQFPWNCDTIQTPWNETSFIHHTPPETSAVFLSPFS